MKEKLKINVTKPQYVQVSDITYAQVDSWYDHCRRDLKLDLIYPEDMSDKRYPCIVWICGGGWIRMDKSAHLSYLSTLAHQGFVVCSVEYRTSNEGCYPMQIEDVKAAIRYLKAHADRYRIDKEHFGAMPTAGLSLGEYGALIASGAMTMADAFAVVRKRGIYMQEAVPTGGAMTAVLGLDPQVIEDICKKTADETNSVVSVANYNCPGQIVITGEKAAVDAAAAACSEAGAKRCVPLKVSGPFHSAMLKGAGEKLADALESVEIHDIKVPYITNVTADYVKSPADVKDYLTKQVSSSVRWQQTIERLIADGADEFVEIGPGRSLSGFMRKINRDVKVVNIDKLEDFEKYVNR